MLGTQKTGMIDSYISDMMRRNRVYGLSICLIKEGKIIYSRGFGLRSLHPPLPATSDTLYGIGSSTKIFTALAVLKLVEKSKVNLQDSVGEYIKGLRSGSKENDMTIHQLLSHTTGYPDLGMAMGTLGQPLGEQDVWSPLGSLDDLVTLINDAKNERVSSDGDVFMYWNEGYVLLGKVIEEASGESYQDFVRKNILLPLDMKRSTFDGSALETDSDSMVGYYTDKHDRKIPRKFPSHPLGFADGGLISSVSELSNLVSMLLNGGNYKGKRIIKKGLLEKAFSPQVEVKFTAEMKRKTFYGYGIFIDKDFLGFRKFGHGGNVAVSSAYFGFVPDLNIGVTLASNSDFWAQPVADYALALSMDKDPEKLPYVSFQRKAETLIGRYETFKGSNKMQILLKGSSLFMEVGNPGQSNSMPLMIDGNKIFLVLGPNKVNLEVSIVSKNDVTIRFERYLFHKIGKI